MALVDSIIGAESGGDPNALNPNSSATGAAQFLSSTWLDTLAKHRPDLTGSPQELLALRNDPNLSKEMAAAYASDNGQILAQAGHPVTPGNTYLAHFAGPKGAVNVLNADLSAPAGQVLGENVVKANPFLANMTVADLRSWADRKMGGQGQSNQPAQTIAQPPAQPVAQPQQPQSLMGMVGNMLMPSQPQGPSPSSLFGQMPAQQIAAAPPPIFAGQRKPVDISKLRAALEASGNRGLLLSRG